MKKQKGFIVPLLAVLVLLAVSAGVYVYENKKASAPVVSNTETPKDENPGWKTFVNTKYGIRVKYPSDWSAKNLAAACGTGRGFDPDCADGIGHGVSLMSLSPYDPITNPPMLNISFRKKDDIYIPTCDKVTIGTKIFCRESPDLVSYSKEIIELTENQLTGKYLYGPYFNHGFSIKYVEFNTGDKEDLIVAQLLIYDFGMEVKKMTENQYEQTKTFPAQLTSDSPLIKKHLEKINQADQLLQKIISSFGFVE